MLLDLLVALSMEGWFQQICPKDGIIQVIYCNLVLSWGAVIFTKFMTNIQNYLPKLIHPTQYNFIIGRQSTMFFVLSIACFVLFMRLR